MSIEIPQIVKSSTPSCGPVSRTDVPAVTVVEINDPTAIGETMELVEQDVVQLDSHAISNDKISMSWSQYLHFGNNPRALLSA